MTRTSFRCTKIALRGHRGCTIAWHYMYVLHGKVGISYQKWTSGSAYVNEKDMSVMCMCISIQYLHSLLIFHHLLAELLLRTNIHRSITRADIHLFSLIRHYIIQILAACTQQTFCCWACVCAILSNSCSLYSSFDCLRTSSACFWAWSLSVCANRG